MLPHNKEWDVYKACEEATLKAQEEARNEYVEEEDVHEDPAPKIVSHDVDRAKKKRNDGRSQRDFVLSFLKPPTDVQHPRTTHPMFSQATISQRSESKGHPQYMVPNNTPVEETESERRIISSDANTEVGTSNSDRAIQRAFLRLQFGSGVLIEYELAEDSLRLI
ncbi:hypothetical protein R1sor_004696 [Riccia sorocarpa]|uniref:Uncharacterized protein n=1 Tax=Riccia sorocarpa TaxID=122646 RepID=A0ABD3HL73_9MARC